jgi:hypothetical protein
VPLTLHHDSNIGIAYIAVELDKVSSMYGKTSGDCETCFNLRQCLVHTSCESVSLPNHANICVNVIVWSAVWRNHLVWADVWPASHHKLAYRALQAVYTLTHGDAKEAAAAAAGAAVLQ